MNHLTLGDLIRRILVALKIFGELAQLVEHRLCKAGVRSSNLLFSIGQFFKCPPIHHLRSKGGILIKWSRETTPNLDNLILRVCNSVGRVAGF